MSLVIPAVLPSSRKDLEDKLLLFSRAPTLTRVQIDVVDGRFASPASWPYTSPVEARDMVERGEMLPRLDYIEYEIDFMAFDVESVIGMWLALGASRLTIHAESITDIRRFILSARARYGSCISFGMAFNIASDPVIIEQSLDEFDYVQFMGIAQIGRQGQPFDPRVLDKVRTFHSRHPDIPIQVDGGVSLANAREIVACDVSSLVVGSALLRADDIEHVITEFDDVQSNYGV